jgi:AcrR family transcriptional regulator
MKSDPTASWLQAGYELFAAAGPAGLKIEVLAKKVGIRKSSFYHHFADLEIFTDLLLAFHVRQAHRLAEKEAACENINPALITVLLAHKTDLLFQRQLRVHRHHPPYSRCLAEASAPGARAFIGLWEKELGLELTPYLMNCVYKLALENFFLQLTEATLNREWLSNYFDQLTRLVTTLGSPAPEIGR